MADWLPVPGGQSSGPQWLDLPSGLRIDMSGVIAVLADAGNPHPAQLLLYTSDQLTMVVHGRPDCAAVRAFLARRWAVDEKETRPP